MEQFSIITAREWILLIAVVVLVFITLVMLARFWKKRKELVKRLLQHGIEAEAIVLDVQPTGLFVNDLPQLKIQVQVKPEKGRNFIAEVQQVLHDSIGKIRAGSRIRIKYDPANPKDIVLLRAA